MTSAAEEIVAYSRTVDKQLAEKKEELQRTRNRVAFEATTEIDPCDLLMAAEEKSLDNAEEVEFAAGVLMLVYFVSDGLHPAKIAQLIFALGAAVNASPFDDQRAAQKELKIYEHAAHARIADIQTALTQFNTRTGYQPPKKYTSLDFVLGRLDDAEYSIRRDAIRKLYRYLVSDGFSFSKIIRRAFALGAHMTVAPFCDLTLREKKKLLGDSHGTHHWLMKKRCEDPLRRRGARSWKGPGQKNLKSRGSYSAAQKGNTNRRKK